MYHKWDFQVQSKTILEVLVRDYIQLFHNWSESYKVANQFYKNMENHPTRRPAIRSLYDTVYLKRHFVYSLYAPLYKTFDK